MHYAISSLSCVNFAPSFETTYINGRYTHIFLFSLVPVAFLPYVFPSPVCISPDVHDRKKKGKVVLPAYLVYTGLFFFKSPGLCSIASYASCVQRYRKRSAFAALL